MTAKEILRVNHIPSPFFVREPLRVGSKTDNATARFHQGIGYDLGSSDGAEAQVNLLLPTIAAGRWVFSSDVMSSTGRGFVLKIVADGFSSEYASQEFVGDGAYHQATLRFEYDAVKRAMLQVRTSSFVNLRNGLQLELASTFDAAVAGGASVLRLGHHAETIADHVGRVMPDDANRESLPGRARGAEAQCVERYRCSGCGRGPLDVHAQRGAVERDRHVRLHCHCGSGDRRHDGQPGFLRVRRGGIHDPGENRRIHSFRVAVRPHEINLAGERAGNGPRRSGLRVRERVESGQDVVRGGGDSLAVRQLGLDAASLTPMRCRCLSVGGDAR